MSLSHEDPNDSTQSRSTIDPDLPSEPDLSGGPSARTRARTQNLNRSESINGDDGPSRPVSEIERGHHDTQAASLAVNPPSTVSGPEVLDPAAPFNPPSRLEERPTSSDTGPTVTESDVSERGSLAVNPPSTVSGPGDGEVLDPATPSNSRSRLEERSGNVDSGPETSSDTGPTVTESDVLERQDNRHSPTAAATANPTTREAPRARHSPTAAATANPTTREAPRARHSPTAAATAEPTTREAPRARHSPTAAATARPTTRNAPRARQARKRYCCAILCFALIVTTLTLSCAIGYKSQSVCLRKLYVAIFRAGAVVTSASLGAYHAAQQVYGRLPIILPIMGPDPRNSSGEVLGAGLGDIYSNLSQALAASNSLYPMPSLISKKRIQATRFRLPGWSLTIKPLGLFLEQTVHIDEFLIILMLSLGKTADTALRQQQLTGDTLRSIQDVEYLRIFQPLRKCLFGTSAQESQLQTRLADHLYLLNETITDSDQGLQKVLADFTALASTAETIRNSTIQDRKRYLWMKDETASQLFWAFRTSIYMLRFSEPEHLAKISQNIELADDIYEWAQDIVDVLQRATLHLQCARIIVGSLMRTLTEFGTVTWDVADKDHKIQEFLALISEGQQLLTYNSEAWFKLQYDGIFP